MRAAGIPILPGSIPEPLGSAAGVAAVFLIHSARALPGFSTLSIRVWPIMGDDGVWFVRVPTVARVGESESIPQFLTNALYRLAGPYPPYRQRTVEEGLAFVDETSRLFVSVVDQYLRAVDSDQDPGLPAAWVARSIVPAELHPDLLQASDVADTTPPQLLSFGLEPAAGTPATDPTVTGTCRIVDDRSGVGDGGASSPSQARLRSGSGQMRDVLFVPPTRISGDERDGTYSSSFTLDEHAERGLWRVEFVLLVDNAGNRQSYASDTLAAQGFLTSILVR
jgi:hypothetical protein